MGQKTDVSFRQCPVWQIGSGLDKTMLSICRFNALTAQWGGESVFKHFRGKWRNVYVNKRMDQNLASVNLFAIVV